MKLGQSIAEFLQNSPQMEVAWLHHIRQSEKFRSTTKVATGNVTVNSCGINYSKIYIIILQKQLTFSVW